jgi:hypothetical protein
MSSILLSLPRTALPVGAVDLPTAIVIGLILGAVVLVIWASRPAVIARYAAPPSQPADTVDPAASAAVPAPPKPSAKKRPRA